MNISLNTIKGIGPLKSKLLNKLGIHDIEDLLYYFPRSYTDKSKLGKVIDCILGEYSTIRVHLIGRPIESRTKNGLLLTKVKLSDDTGSITAIWYNNRFIKETLKGNCEFIMYGKISLFMNEKVIEAPEFQCSDNKDSLNLLRIVPEYSLTEGLTSKDIRKFINDALYKYENLIQDLFTNDIRKKYELAEINFCLRNIHFPDSQEALEISRYRFKFEELFILQYALSNIKTKNNDKEGIVFKEYIGIDQIINRLPYKLTNAQSLVLEEVFNDMKSKKIMNRLIQGDVGSGKTIIAILALLLCAKNHYQGLIMVPTEILASQHFSTFCDVLKGEDLNIELLKGNISGKSKENILRKLKDGDIDILIGTHAIIQDNVEFKNLGLVITDEQHRFGVRQRALLSEKGLNPDVLVMTATPIPRTLTLILYGDLDVSIISEKPFGRKDIETYFIDSNRKDRLFSFMKKNLNEGRQAYFVCPLIEQSEKLDLKSAIEHFELLKNEVFNNYNVDLLHGKMKNSEKDKIMEEFRKGNIQILISTTVIEVGVNVPNATFMVIENAERFGLAQLHQLRGRVGRGEFQSYCILISDTNSKIAKERLSYLTKSNDGFQIADKDLQLRGGGEILGLKQHGIAELKIADIYNDMEIIKSSREAVNLLMKNLLGDSDSNEKIFRALEMRLVKMLEGIVLN